MSSAGLLAVARAAARAGAEVLAERWRSHHPGVPASRDQLGAETKSSGSDWVTDYDRRAEDAVRAVLRAYRPHDEITGEEHGKTVPERPSGYRWSIDPLDGTTNFVRGIPQFACSVAVMGPAAGEGGAGAGGDGDNAEPVWWAGAVVAPALGRSWYARRGHGAFTTVDSGAAGADLDDAGAPVRLHGPVAERSGKLLATGFGYDPDRRARQLEVLGALMADFGDVRRIGSAALDLCMVADGTLDAYAEFGTHEYDWAAGALIAEEAGVRIERPTHPDGTDHPSWMLAGDFDPELLHDLRGLTN
ncbi:MAG: inositol monophosphatase family protein [Micrococcus sp.]|nr:inositol monophosphatase family protein [Micrococcus sp.]